MLRRLAISAVLIVFALSATARTRPHYGSTLRVDTQGDPWQRPDGTARRLVLDGLTRIDTAGTVRPALAIAWNSENANHRWQFKLRPSVHFHDGSPLTSIAVASSLMAACGNACPWTNVRATGASVIFTSDDPMPNLPALLSIDDFLIAQTTGASVGTTTLPIGTGPFQATGFVNGVLTLTANDSSWQGRPFVDAIEIRGHRSVGDQWADLAAGRADVVDVPAENIRQAQQQKFTLLISQPVDLLALQVADASALANQNLRAAIAFAIDRTALANVIFQKQGQASAALLPQSLSGYAFLFPSDRDLNKAHEARGGITPPLLTMQVEGSGAIQLAAQRIVLNLREAGFNVQIVPGGPRHADLILRRFRLEGGEAGAVLENVLRLAGQRTIPSGTTPEALYRSEREFLDRKTLIPLLHLPRATAISAGVRDAHLLANGVLDLADISLETAR